MINKSSKEEEKAIQEVDVGGANFALNADKNKSLFIAPFSKEITVQDPIAFKILMSLLSDPLWDIRMLHAKKMIIDILTKLFICFYIR